MKTLSKNFAAITIALILMTLNSFSQTSITLKPGGEEGIDATIRSLSPDTNYGEYPDLSPRAWTNSLNPITTSELLKFDLSIVPTDATIVSAELSLFFNPTSSNGYEHSCLSGPNTLLIQKITDEWDENTVTWNNQPNTVTTNQVTVPQTWEGQQDYLYIDVTDLTIDIFQNQSANYGMMLRLNNEIYYRRMIFASSDHTDDALHPQLTITYFEPSENFMILKPGGNEGKDATLRNLSPNTNYGNYPYLSPRAWTNAGEHLVTRELIQFDLSFLPQEAMVLNAQLYLYYCPNSSTGAWHSNMSGFNNLWIRRVTSEWDELSVTWNSEPSTTTQNQVEVPPTKCPTQNYPHIDVTNLINDMLGDSTENHGMMLKLQDEMYYRRMIFASGDHSNPLLHPKLVISYDEPTGENPGYIRHEMLQCSPNPTTGQITVKKCSAEKATVSIVNICGQTIYTDEMRTETKTIDLSAQPNGIYFLRLATDQDTFTEKIIRK